MKFKAIGLITITLVIGSILAAIVTPDRQSELISNEPPVVAVSMQDGPGVVPSPSPDPIEQEPDVLKRIEYKLDKVLANTKTTVKELEGLKQSNRANALDIVAAIKDLKTCPDCPTEPARVEPKATPPKPDAVVTKVKYRSVSSPRWRINGKVWTRTAIISHLISHPNHSGKYSRSSLEAMTLGQLWALHDDDHDAGTLDVIPVNPTPTPNPGTGPCPGGVCPTFKTIQRTRSRRVLFPNAFWNR